MKRILSIILFFFFISEISLAEVYRWVDDKGVVYFTDDITQVPEKYRPKAERMGLPEGKEETKAEPESPQKKDEAYRDRLGRGEDYWKGKVEEWRKKLRESQVKLEALRVKYSEVLRKQSTAIRAAAVAGSAGLDAGDVPVTPARTTS